MASSNLKYTACAALRTWLAANTTVPSANIGIASASHEEPTAFPSIRIVPRRFEFEPAQEIESDDATYSDKLLVEVGTISGEVELWLSDVYPRNREAHEQEVLDAFTAIELAPGVVTLALGAIDVGGLTWPAAAPQASYELGAQQWRDELAFDKKRRSFVDLNVLFPVYARRDGVHLIDQLVLALTNDLSSDVPTEQVQVNDSPPPDILPYP